MKLLVTSALLLAFSVVPAQGSTCFVGPPAGTMLGNLRDAVYPAAPIGFAFPFGGATYTDIHVSDHGFAALSNGGTPTPPAGGQFTYTPSLANFAAGRPILAAMWSDSVGGSTTPGAGVHIDNSSPTSCRIEWRSVASFGFPAPEFDLAMTLFPNGQVQFDYGVNVTNNSLFGGVADHGVVGVFTGGALPGSVDLSAGGAATNHNTFEQFVVANTFDMANNRLLLTPANPGWQFALLGPSSACAAAVDFGEGCGGDPSESVYEAFSGPGLSGPPFDLAQTSFRWIRSASGYSLVQQPAPFVAPSANAQPVAAGATDGQQAFTLSAPMPYAVGTTNTLNVRTKGQVELDGPPIQWFFMYPSLLQDWPNTAFHCWHDFDQASPGSGPIVYEEVAGVAYVTWNGVHSRSVALPSTVQWQFDVATGDVALVVLGAAGILAATYDSTFVGYSVGGASILREPTDLSALTGVIAIPDAPAVCGPLWMTHIGLPFVGNALFQYTISDIPASSPLAFQMFGTSALSPAVDLTAIGMPGCFAYTSADLGATSEPAMGGNANIGLPIPASNALAGVSLTAQAVVFSQATPLNLVTSNGNTVTIGF